MIGTSNPVCRLKLVRDAAPKKPRKGAHADMERIGVPRRYADISLTGVLDDKAVNGPGSGSKECVCCVVGHGSWDPARCLLFATDALVGSRSGRFHVHDAAGSAVTLRPEARRRLELGSVTNGTVAVSVTFGGISSHCL